MAGNSDSQIVSGAGARDGAHRLRRSDAPGELGVGNRLAGRDLLERLPYALLEGCAADVDGKIEAPSRRFNQADNLRDQGLIIAIRANEMRFRKAVLKIADQLVRIVSEQDRGDALPARSNEDGAQ